MKPEWFPDWSQSFCAIIGGGESVKSDDVDALHHLAKVIVINRSHELAPWADVLYAADRRFWDVFEGVRHFGGLKVTPNRDAANHFRLNFVDLIEQGSPQENSLSLEPSVVARGGHSGHQALNLALQFGVRRVILLGFDFVGEHWHGRHQSPLRNPQPKTLEKWREHMDALAPLLKNLSVEVLNCSQISRLTAYPKVPIADALAMWSGGSMSRKISCDARARQTQPEMESSVLPLV